jgi:hypothetical protein
MKPGRKPADKSHATAIRTLLLSWCQEPEEQRPSFRALAEELGTTHQLLGFYLKGLDKWQKQECHRKMEELNNRVQAENRLMSPVEQAQMVAYGRAALNHLVDSALDVVLKGIEAEFKAGKLKRGHIQMVNRMARKGHPAAQRLLASLKE